MRGCEKMIDLFLKEVYCLNTSGCAKEPRQEECDCVDLNLKIKEIKNTKGTKS
jgi:hypothetical protein